jgi:hypothetical protein
MVINQKCILLLKCLEIIFSRFDDHERYLKPPAVGEVSEKYTLRQVRIILEWPWQAREPWGDR